jgi:hypothetical protein
MLKNHHMFRSCQLKKFIVDLKFLFVMKAVRYVYINFYIISLIATLATCKIHNIILYSNF